MVTYLGSLVQSCYGEGGTQQTNITGMCGECSQCQLYWVCPQRVCFPSLHCSGSRLLCQGTVYGGPRLACTSHIYATQVQILGYSTKAQTWLGLRFVPFPGPSGSGSQVFSERTLPRCGASYHLPCPTYSVSWERISGVPCVSSGELTSGCNPPGGCQPSRIQEDLISNWEPACSLVEDAVS